MNIIDIKTDSNLLKERMESMHTATQPYYDMAYKILAMSCPTYIVTDDNIKAKYPYSTLKSLVYIRTQIREIQKLYLT